jgi:hypothetical protein
MYMDCTGSIVGTGINLYYASRGQLDFASVQALARPIWGLQEHYLGQRGVR